MTTWWPEGYTHTRVFYPPGPPPLSAAFSNPHPPPWRYQPHQTSGTVARKSSGATGSSASEPVAHMHSRGYRSSYPQLDLDDGVEYFKIGEVVRIRRWTAATDSWSAWYTGTVLRPMLSENEDGTQRRSYLVSYTDTHNKQVKDRLFSTHFQEIASLDSTDPDSATPSLRLNDESNIVFAPTPVGAGNVKRVLYSPVLVLTQPNAQGRVRIRVLDGPAANREISNFLVSHSLPYSAASAQSLRQLGNRVVGDGINRAF